MSSRSSGRMQEPTDDIDSGDETPADDGEVVWIADDRCEATPDLPDDESEPDDEELMVFDGAAWKRVREPPAIASQPHGLPPGYERLQYHGLFGDIDLTMGVNVALTDGDFFHIKYLLTNMHKQHEIMYGWRLRRACRVENRLGKVAGELCMLVTASIDDKRPDWERGLEKVSLEQIDFEAEKWIRDIVFTNQEEPALRDDLRFLNDVTRHVREGRLVCRRKHVVLGELGVKPIEQSIEWFRKEDADGGYGIWDEAKILSPGKARYVETMRSQLGSEQAKREFISKTSDAAITTVRRTKKRRNDAEFVEEDVQMVDELAFQQATRKNIKPRSRRNIIQYVAADVCCGGGGASGGIEETPFSLAWGLDKDTGAARTWSLNWPGATTYHMDIGEFVKDGIDKCAYAHAIHFSFSCKAWSYANPRKGDYDANPDDIATTLAAPDLLRRLRPRLATFENADAFQTIRKHRPYFDAFLKSIIDQGYNIRWRIIDLARYGNPQHRKRLIVIASCSGETLPEFPPFTHGPERGLQRFRTVRDSIRGTIHRDDPLHNKKQMLEKWRLRPLRNMLPAEWDEPLPHGITTGGPTDLYPSGERVFTVRECMELMRFRAEHKLPQGLCLTKMREIIGNAVPRDLIRLIYTDFYRVLRDTDAKIERYLNVSLDEDVEMSTPKAAPARPGSARPPAGQVKRTRVSPSDSDNTYNSDEELPDLPPRPFAVAQRAPREQRTIHNVFGIRRDAACQPTAMVSGPRPFGDVDYMDLTKD